MAESSFPFYGHETSEDQFTDWSLPVFGDGILDGLTLAAGSGMTVNVGAGTAFVSGRCYQNSSTKGVTVGAAPASGTRLDAVVLRADFATKTIVAAVKAGTTAGGGTLPAMTQTDATWEVLIGTVSVAAGTVSLTGGMIVEVRPVQPLRVHAYSSDAGRPVVPVGGVALGVNTSTRVLEVCVGGAWLKTVAGSIADTLPVSKGGTGATTKAGAREALGIYVRNTPLDGTNAVDDLRFY